MRCRAMIYIEVWISPAASGIRASISYDLVGFIPVEELLKQETA